MFLLGHLTNQGRVDQSQQTGPSDQSEQSRPITAVRVGQSQQAGPSDQSEQSRPITADWVI